MTRQQAKSLSRRELLARSAGAAAGVAALGGGAYWTGRGRRAPATSGRMMIVIGIDGMDPRLAERMMASGELPHLAKLRAAGGFSPLGTSCPPQSPVAWANFINGAGPGSHGIFDFIHRHPEQQCLPFYSAAETLPGEGGWETGDYKLPLDFWPFNHRPPRTVLRRQGVPFWDFLDAAGVPSTFYDLPSNYPPSPSQYGHHRCLCGMGTPDMLGGYGTYQLFDELGPSEPVGEEGGRRARLVFAGDTAPATLVGPDNSFLKQPRPVTLDFLIHRDRQAQAAAIDLGGERIVLRVGQWSRWTRVDFNLATPAWLPDQAASGICRFYLQEVSPRFRLYVSPLNVDPRAPATAISEPGSFVEQLGVALGPFYTTGFQEDHKARSNGVFNDAEFLRQADLVLDERLALLHHAIDDFDGGLLFFYFSSSDLQSHIFWWDSDAPHPIRAPREAQAGFAHVRRLYRRLDEVVGDLVERYGQRAGILVLSDHGFANFGRQFNLNSWLRDCGYLGPPECTSLLRDVDWSQTAAYGMGINGLYLNLKGRERDGIIEPGEQREALLGELIERLESLTDFDGQQVIRGVYRADKIYSGSATALAPDLVIGYRRGYRASWATCLGDLTEEVLSDNNSAWSADHCADALEVPGVLFSNRPLRRRNPSLVDLAPTILAEFGLPAPGTMSGKNLF